MPAPLTTAAAARVATATILLLTSYNVGARAVRDALFLSTFDARLLPAMTAIGAVASLVVALLGAERVRRLGPSVVAPPALLASAVALLGVWGLSFYWRAAAAVLLYLHIAALGGLLFSLFWSVLNERLDPHAIRRHVGRIGIGASIGGLLGGGVVFAAASVMPASALLPLLAAAHAAAALLLRRLGADMRRSGLERAAAEGRAPAWAALSALRDAPMLRDLAWLVGACATASALLDFLFKMGMQGAIPEESGLIRAFALFHGVGALATVLAQSLLLRVSLDRAGVGRTVATLPGALAGGAVFSLFAPGVGAYATTWLLENILRGSFFRSGYEMLFTPLPPAIKRGGKALVDIGASRLGDIAGAGIVAACLALFASRAHFVVLIAIAALGVAGVAAAVRLDREYRTALALGLRSRAAEAELPPGDEDPYTRTMVLDTVTLRRVREVAGLAAVAPAAGVAGSAHEGAPPLASASALTPRPSFPPAAPPGSAPPSYAPPSIAPPPAGPPVDPLSLTQMLPRFTAADLAELAARGEFEALRTPDIERVRDALSARTFSAAAMPLVIHWLADDRVAVEAAAAIRRVLADHASLLAAALRDPALPLTARRRLPRLLRASADGAIARALLDSLFDERFDVRTAAARALARARVERPGAPVDRERIFAAVESEIAAGRPFWESKNAFHDPMADDADDTAAHGLDSFVRERSGRALEHVFTLLSLVLEREPLRLAYQALTTEDETLRGYALEYLEIELPPRVRDRLRPFLGIPGAPASRARSREEALADLARQNQTVRIRLDEIRKRLADS
jgi:hypothetical protein